MISLLPLGILLIGICIIHALPARTFLRAHRLEPKEGWWLLAFSAIEVPINTVLVTALLFGLKNLPNGQFLALSPLVIALAVMLVKGWRSPLRIVLAIAMPRILSSLLSIGFFIVSINAMTGLDAVTISFAVIAYALTVISAIYLWRQDIANRKWTRPHPNDKLDML